MIRTQGPMAATRFIQGLLRSPQATPPATSTETRFEPAADVDARTFEHVPPRPLRADAQVQDVPAVLPPASGQFLDKRFSGPAGARNFKVYVPSSYDGTPLPMVVMLHGCTQDPNDFATGTRANRWAESRRFLVVYPEQIQRANAHRCWNWFRSVDQRAGRGEPAIITGIVQQVLGEYQIDARRVYVAGLSAGGAMAAIMGHAYPEFFAAIGVHSGLPTGAAHDISSALALMKNGRAPAALGSLFQYTGNLDVNLTQRAVPLIVLHGNDDRTVNPANAKLLVDDAIEARRVLNPDSPLQSHTQTIDATASSYGYRRTEYAPAAGGPLIEQWEIHGAGHAWSGGDAQGSHTDSHGPDATAAMLEFFARHAVPETQDAPPVIDSSVPA